MVPDYLTFFNCCYKLSSQAKFLRFGASASPSAQLRQEFVFLDTLPPVTLAPRLSSLLLLQAVRRSNFPPLTTVKPDKAATVCALAIQIYSSFFQLDLERIFDPSVANKS